MERHGDIVAELSNRSTLNCSLIGNCFNTAKYKMCKDDIVAPLFCSTPHHLKNGLVMGSQNLSPKGYLNSDESSLDLNYFSPRNSGIRDELHYAPIIHHSSNSLTSIGVSDAWQKPPALKNFSPLYEGGSENEKSYVPDLFLNGHKVEVPPDVPAVTSSVSNKQSSSDLSLIHCDLIDEKLKLDYEAETSASSFEDVCPSNKSSERLDSQIPKYDIKGAIDSQTLNRSSLPKFGSKENKSSPTNSDRAMPQLIPTLICLDDDSESTELHKKFEVVNVADSPEMPTLFPFSSEIEDAIRIKTEVISDSESRHQDENSKDSKKELDSTDNQPKVMLERLEIDPTAEKEDDWFALLSTPVKREMVRSFIESPEIEEIEDVRFFQFHSKRDMEEFHEKSHSLLSKTFSLFNEIVPTKTFDITQIKGWRNKFFAPDCDFNPKPLAFNLIDLESKSNPKVSANLSEETQNNDSCNQEHNCSAQVNDLTSTNAPLKNASGNSQNHPIECGSVSDQNDEKFDLKKVKIEKMEHVSGPKSAFISPNLDEYLSNSSKLNISFLQKVNPNITPIAPDAPILSIGKLRKRDGPSLPLSLIYRKKREMVTPSKFENQALSDSVLSVDVTPESLSSPDFSTESSTETSSSSSSSSSDDDLPVSILKTPKTSPVLKKRTMTNKVMKRKNLRKDFDQASKRVVLRLKKDSDGASKSYKVSDISCKTDNTEASLSDVSLDSIPIPNDGTLPIIKKTLFGKKDEPQLLDEFLNNLNMYGTRKDVAMLVQSNQSYFNEGPTLSPQICSKAVSVLVSSKGFMEFKLKKKLKTWQKYLPKKLSEGQKLKIKGKRVRKTRIQSLLDDAENIISEERTKRSIRLPARYLDSAVLAPGSEWVSPVIEVEDSISKKSKIETVEVLDCNNEPTQVIELVSDDSSKKSETSTEESSSESSSESSDLEEINVVPLVKSTPKNQSDIKPVVQKKPVMVKLHKIAPPSLASSDISMSSTSNAADSEPGNSVKYILPRCCKLSSRTAVFDARNKVFYCLQCTLKYEMLHRKKFNKKIKKVKSTGIFAKKVAKSIQAFEKDENVSELPIISSVQTVSVNENNTKNVSLHSYFDAKLDTADFKDNGLLTSNAVLSPTQSSAGKLACSTLTDQENNPAVSTVHAVGTSAHPDLETKLVTLDESKSNITNVPVSTVAGKNLIYVLTPIQSRKALLCSSPSIAPNVDSMQGKAQPAVKPKPSILSRKTSVDSSSIVFSDDASTSQSSSNPGTSKTTNLCGSGSAALLLSNIAQNHLLLMPPGDAHPALNSFKEGTNHLVPNALNKDPKKLVTAYKVGSSVFLMQPSPVTAVPPKAVANSHPAFPVISSVQSQAAIVSQSETIQNYQFSSSCLAKCPVPISDGNSSPSPLAKLEPQSQIQETSDQVADHNYNKLQAKHQRKSPLSKKQYNSSEDEQFVDVVGEKYDEDDEVDVTTIDDSCSWAAVTFENWKRNAKQKARGESDSDISDQECAFIFKSPVHEVQVMYEKKTIQERKRRLLIKTHIENLKASSKSFKESTSLNEVLNMAVHVIETAKKKEKILALAKKRLKIHNTMLMEKLVKMLNGILPLNVRNKIKAQIIKNLALDRFNSKRPLSFSSLVSKQQNWKTSKSSLGEGSNLGSGMLNSGMVHEGNKRKMSTSDPYVEHDFEIKLPNQEEVDIPCHEKTDEITVITPPKKRKLAQHAPSDKKECIIISDSPAEQSSRTSNAQESQSKTISHKLDNSTKSGHQNLSCQPSEQTPNQVSKSLKQFCEMVTNQSQNSGELESSKPSESVSCESARLEEAALAELAMVKESFPPEIFASPESGKKQSSNSGDFNAAKDIVLPKAVDPPPLSAKGLELKKLLTSGLPIASVSNELGTASKSNSHDDLKGAAGKLEICEMRRKVKSSLHKRVINIQKSSESESKSSESDSDLSSQNSAENPTKKPKMDLKDDAQQVTEMRKKVIESLPNNDADVEENMDSDTEALDSDSDSDSSVTSSSIVICDDTSDEKSPKAEESSAQQSNTSEADLPKLSKDDSYPGLIPLYHPKVFQENIGKPLLSNSPLQPPPSNPGESSQQSPCTLSSGQLSQASNQNEVEENDDIEIVGSKIVNPFSAGAKAMHRFGNSKGDLPAGTTGAAEHFPHLSVQKVQLRNGTTMFAYKPDAGSLSSRSDSSTSRGHNLVTNVRNLSDASGVVSGKNKGILNQNKQQSPPEEIVLSDSEDESQEASNSLPAASSQEDPPSNPPPSPLTLAIQSIERPEDVNSMQQIQSDWSDSDDDRMHIDESCTNDAEDL